MRKLSRSSNKDFSDCPRRGYYTYLHKGVGLSPATPNFNFLIGLGVHKGLEILLRSGRIEEALRGVVGEWEHLTQNVVDPGPALAHQLDEGVHLCQALVLGWWMTRYDSFIEEFEVVSIEEEERLQLTASLIFMARADAVVRERATGRLLVFNWKTTRQKRDWNLLFSYDVQAWTEALVIEQKLGEPVSGCVFEGFFKGVQLGAVNSSPLIYGHRHPSTGEISTGYRRGWNRFPVWKEMSLPEWFDRLDSQTISDQFLRSEPIYKNDEVVREWLESVVFQEDAIQHVLQNGSDKEQLTFFKQNFSKWNCDGCAFKRACFKHTDIPTLEADGLLVPRVDHHALPGETN
jgi:hypothetical protein